MSTSGFDGNQGPPKIAASAGNDADLIYAQGPPHILKDLNLEAWDC